MSASPKHIAAVLGGQDSLGQAVETARDLETVVTEGVTKVALDNLVAGFAAHHTAQSANDMRFQIVPRATYNRVDRFNLQTSETIERIARVYATALDAFGDQAHATRFLMSPHPELDGRTPFKASLTELGGRAVEEVIERGLHGLPV